MDGLIFKLGLPKFNKDDLTYFMEYCAILQPFTIALNILLQGDKNTCIGMLLPILSKFKVNVLKAGEKSCKCKSLSQALIKGIDTRFSSDLRSEEFILAGVPTPMFKFEWIESEKDQRNALQILKKELKWLEDAIREENKVEESPKESSEPPSGFERFFPINAKPNRSGVDQILDQYNSD